MALGDLVGETGVGNSQNYIPPGFLHGGLGIGVGVFFILGLIAAAYSSADSALTSLTTAFCVDFLKIENKPKNQQINQRKWVHIGFSLVLIFAILIFKAINDESVIAALFKVAGYTYGPLLGLYAFGLFTNWKIKDHLIIPVVLLAPILSYILQLKSPVWWGFNFGFELLIVNGALCFFGMLLIRKR